MNFLAFQIPAWSPVVVAIILIILLNRMRKPGRGGAVGRAIRNSDWHSWKSAVEDKERELAELKAAEPKR
jgi:Sec-independent protein translocase protein TatA